MRFDQPMRLSVNLHQDVATEISEIAEREGKTVTQVIAEAISNYSFYREEIKKGGRVLIEYPNDKYVEVVYK